MCATCSVIRRGSSLPASGKAVREHGGCAIPKTSYAIFWRVWFASPTNQAAAGLSIRVRALWFRRGSPVYGKSSSLPESCTRFSKHEADLPFLGAKPRAFAPQTCKNAHLVNCRGKGLIAPKGAYLKIVSGRNTRNDCIGATLRQRDATAATHRVHRRRMTRIAGMLTAYSPPD